jgi:hypothetical protein
MQPPLESRRSRRSHLGRPVAGVPHLLQNMGCRPNATVEHTGAHDGRALRIGFALPPDRAPRLTDVSQAIGRPRLRGETALHQLERLAAESCALLTRLPPVAAVRSNAQGEQVPGLTDDPLLVLAVLTRCHGALFLRDRPPCVTTDRLFRSITLLAPRTWNPTP